MGLVEEIAKIIDNAKAADLLVEGKFGPYGFADLIIASIADDIEKMNIRVPEQRSDFFSYYIQGAKDEHAYIVDYLRGLLNETG